ncbi:MAG: hypothetical protein IT258_06745 [Saprospiraceae bacterium]|nr:hypothetical protein [Saprospiraceae bacterium]
MHNTEIWAYLRALNSKELRQLRLWLLSPAFNQREEVLRLFDFLEKSLNKKNNRDLTRESAWAAVFPTEAFDEKKLHYTVHYLLRLAQKFMAFQEMEQDTCLEQRYLCRALKKRQMPQFFESEMRSLDRLHERNPHHDAEFQFDRFLFHAEQHDHIIRQSRSAELPLQPLLEHLGSFFMATLLRYACSALTRTTVANQHFQLRLLPEVLHYLEAKPPDPVADPAVAVYYRCYLLLDGRGGDADFQALKAFLTERWQAFPMNEMRDIWLLAINYGIRRLNGGDRPYVRETFELYREGLEKGILPGEGNMTEFTYKNIARLGLGLNEYAWTERFLHDAKRFLEPRHRENHFRYNLAFYHYHQKDLDAALQLLSGVDMDDVFLQLDARSMLLRIYFEKGYHDALESLLESFQTYVKRQTNLGYQRDNYLNLIRLTKKLLQTPLGDKAACTKLVEEIKATQSVAERNWLLDKAASGA